MSKESKEQIREPRTPYAATAEVEVEERITMPPLSPHVRQAVQIIQGFKVRERDQFLHLLPSVLNISSEDYGWLKAAESAFEFWDNDEDAVYDQM